MAAVLVCDDDPGIRGLLEMALGGPHEVSVVADGARALATLEAGKPRVDVLILDIMMPGLDGFEVLRRVRADPVHQDLPVILLTARVAEEDYLRGYRIGADAYVSKPFEIDVLLETIAAVLARPAEERHRIREDERAKASLLRQLERRFS